MPWGIKPIFKLSSLQFLLSRRNFRFYKKDCSLFVLIYVCQLYHSLTLMSFDSFYIRKVNLILAMRVQSSPPATHFN